MKMETNILEEIREIRMILSKITGTKDLPEEDKFSEEALEKAAKEFQNMVIKRGEWISNNDLYQVFKDAAWKTDKFIIEKFGFNNYFMRGRTIYFNKKDLIALRNELKERRIDLNRYMELIEDQEKFEQSLTNLESTRGKGKKKSFHIPEELQDIETKPYLIAEEIIRKDIEGLKAEFNIKKLIDYIDIYHKGTYAMFKEQYWFDKYLEPGKRKECKNWIERFNYANHAFEKMKEIQQQEAKEHNSIANTQPE